MGSPCDPDSEDDNVTGISDDEVDEEAGDVFSTLNDDNNNKDKDSESDSGEEHDELDQINKLDLLKRSKQIQQPDGQDSENSDSDSDDSDAGSDKNVPSRQASTGKKKKQTNKQASSNSSQMVLIEDIKYPLFLCYSKYGYGIENADIVIEGAPFKCESGEHMGRILNSKSPAEWANVQTRNITVLTSGGVDFLYITCYVDGSPEQEFDKKRVHTIPIPVAEALVNRFNQVKMSDDRRRDLERLLNYKLPVKGAGPQINPFSARFDAIEQDGQQVASCRIPTACQKPKSKPRVLKSQSGKYGRKSAARIDQYMSPSNDVTSAKSGVESSTSDTKTVDHAAVNSAPSFDSAQEITTHVEPLGPSSTSSKQNRVRSDETSTDVSYHETTGVKRIRTLKVDDKDKTNLFMAPNGSVYIIEHF